MQFRTHENHEDRYEDGFHQYFRDDRKSMTHSAERKQGEPEAHQRKDNLRILSFQPRRTMAADEPPSCIRIEHKRSNNFVLAGGALRHGRFPLSLFVPTVPRPLRRVNGTYDSLCP